MLTRLSGSLTASSLALAVAAALWIESAGPRTGAVLLALVLMWAGGVADGHEHFRRRSGDPPPRGGRREAPASDSDSTATSDGDPETGDTTSSDHAPRPDRES